MAVATTFNRERPDETPAQALARHLGEFVNGSMRQEDEAFVEAFLHEHRTLQQKAVGLLMKLLEGMAARDPQRYAGDGNGGRGFDLRNEWATRLAGLIVDRTEESDRRMPLI